MDEETIVKQFEEVEQKVEGLLEVCRSLERTNSELRDTITELQGELQGKVAAENKHIKERDLIRSRIDMLLAKLENVAES